MTSLAPNASLLDVSVSRLDAVLSDADGLEELAQEQLDTATDPAAIADALRLAERAATMRCKAVAVAQDAADAEGVDSAEALMPALGALDLREGCVASAARLVVRYNAAAVAAFRDGSFDLAGRLLADAFAATETAGEHQYFLDDEAARRDAQATTLNNLGCMERRRGRLAVAAQYLKQAQNTAPRPQAPVSLNLAAVLMQLGRPVDAVAAARSAIAGLEAAAVGTAEPGLLAVAHHNLALGLEVLDRDGARREYQAALDIARAELGAASPITRSIEGSCARFTAAVDGAPGAAFAAPPLSKGPGPPRTPTPPSSRPGSEQQARPGSHCGAESMTLTVTGGRLTVTDIDVPDTAEAEAEADDGAPSQARRSVASVADDADAGNRDAAVAIEDAGGYTSYIDGPRSTTAKRRLSRGESISMASKPPTPNKPTPLKGAPGQPPVVTRNGRLVLVSDDEAKRQEDVVGFLFSRLCRLLRDEAAAEVEYLAARRIQCAVRCRFARAATAQRHAELLAVADGRLRRVDEAARTIVRALRTAQRMQIRERRDAERAAVARARAEAAAVKAQAVVRRWLAVRRVDRLVRRNSREDAASRVIQRAVATNYARAVALRLRATRVAEAAARTEREAEHRAACRVQAAFRWHLARVATLLLRGDDKAAEELAWNTHRHRCARRIQSLFRAFLVRRVHGPLLADRRKRRANRRRTAERAAAASELQRFGRASADRARLAAAHPQWLARRREADTQRRASAALKLQCAVRCHRARCVLRAKRAEWRHAYDAERRAANP